MTEPHRSGLPYRLTLSWLKVPAARVLLKTQARGGYAVTYDGNTAICIAGSSQT